MLSNWTEAKTSEAPRRRIAFYYQTFTQHDNCLNDLDPRVTDLYVAAVHFGHDPVTKKPYIHLNDHPPPYFNTFFEDLDKVRNDVRVHVMIGGAGGGLAPLIQKPTIYMPMLQSFLLYHDRITGINIDVEEPGISTDDVCQLLQRLHELFRGYELSLAPIASPASGTPYPKDTFQWSAFLQRQEANLVRTYLVQMYSDFTVDALNAFMRNKTLLSSNILVGTISDQFKYRMKDLGTHYYNMLAAHPDLGGAFDWEMYDAPSDWVDTVANCHQQFIDDAEVDDWGVHDFCLLL